MAAASKGQILVVDDSTSARRQARSCMTEAGYVVFEARNGSIAMEILECETPDAVFLDVHMPLVDGMAVLEWIRRTDRLKTVPVAMVTTEPSIDLRKKAMAMGATVWLLKPLTPQMMLGTVAALLKHASENAA